MLSKAVPMSEPFGITDIFVSGLGRVEDLGDGNYRFVFFALKHGDAEVVASIIMPLTAVPTAMSMSARAVGMSFAQTFVWERAH